MATLATLTVKLQAQIAEFQADFKEATKSTQKFQDEFQSTATKSVAAGNLISKGIQDVVRAVADYGVAILENASNIKDLSQQTGLTMKTIQQFQSVASQTGTTLQSFTTAATTLGTKLAGGGSSVVKAIEDLGLSFTEIQRLSPDEQFLKIADALGRMEDPQERNRIALQLFGRTFKELMPAMEEGYRNLARAAKTSSDEQINALSDAENAWKRFKQDSLTTATSWAGNLILQIEEVGRVGDRMTFFERLGTMMPGNINAMSRFAEELATVRQEANAINLSKVIQDMQRISLLQLKPAEGPTFLQFGTAEMKAVEAELDAGLKRQKTSFNGARTAVDEYGAALKRIADAQIPLTASQKDQILQLDALGIGHHDIAIAVKASEIAVRNYTTANDTLNRLIRDQIPLLKANRDGWTDLIGPITLTEHQVAQLAITASRLNQLKPLSDSVLADAGAGIRTFMDEMGRQIQDRAGSTVNPFREAFTSFGQDLPHIIFGALQGGGSILGAVASGLAVEFSKVFAARLAESIKNDTPLSFSSKALGVASTGLSALLQGYGFGEEFGKGKGALAGAGAGALAGVPLAAVTGGLSIVVGGIAGAIGGWLGGMKKAKEQLAELRQAQAAVLQEFGGFANLKAKADEFGISLGNALTTKKPEEFTRVMERLGKAIDEQKTRIEGFGIAVEGINAKAALFAAPFEALLQNKDIEGFTAKLAEMGRRGQAEFERIGTFAAAAFAGMVKESGDAIGAINALAPTLTILQQGLTQFGLTSTGTIDSLLGMFSFINDAVTGPIFANIQATGQIFDGLTKGGLVTKDIFQTVATDIGASFRELERKGGDVSKAMALSQPVLQALWEGQQRYGRITDETTQRILAQAEDQGLVGKDMKGVNDQILAVLIEIRDIFGKDLPKAFQATKDAAAETARRIEQDFERIKIRIPIEYVDTGFDPTASGKFATPLAHGGIVRQPTLALIGESGPEAVIPLNQLASVSPQVGSSIHIWEVGGRVLAEATVEHLPGVVRHHLRPR